MERDKTEEKPFPNSVSNPNTTAERNLIAENKEQHDFHLKKFKRMARGAGAVSVGAGVATGFILLKDISLDLNPTAFSTYFNYGKAALGLIPAYFVADGIADMVKGTHHYLGLTAWKKLSRNPETKLKIQKDIDRMSGR